MKKPLVRRLVIGGIVVLACAAFIIAAIWPKYQETPPESWSLDPNDPTALVVKIMGGIGTINKVTILSEADTSVQVTGWYRDPRPGWTIPAIPVPYYITVHLKAPLGDREVINRQGLPVPEERLQ